MIPSAAVTPIVFEYGHDHPWVRVLEAFPLYESMARVKFRAHWQGDVVVVGWALGTALGLVIAYRTRGSRYYS